MSFKDRTDKIAEMLENREQEYGSAYEKVEKLLNILYPSGILPENYKEVAVFIRIFDTMMRISHSKDYKKGWKYIAGYGVLMMGDE